MIIGILKKFLEDIDKQRDKFLFPFIKKYWPRKIIPNYLSFLRVIIGGILGVLLFSGSKNTPFLFSLYCFGLSLDLFDGSVARALNKKTKIGAMLDPIADKVLIIPVAFYVLITHLPWILLFILIPEVISAFDAVYYKARSGVVIEANIFGKTRMVLYALAFGIILFNFPNLPDNFSIVVLLLAASFGFLSIFFQWLDFQKSLENNKDKVNKNQKNDKSI